MTTDDSELLRALQQDLREEISAHRERMREHMDGLEQKMRAKFRELRLERGWSQVDVIEKLAEVGFDLHQSTFAKLESGKRPLSVAEMFALAHVFGIPPAAVLLMPREGLTYGMEYMTKRLEELDSRLHKGRQDFMSNLEAHVDHYADVALERTALIREMRAAASGPDGQNA